ncbi:MAG: glycosyl hydrolase 115 family protein, partial [Bacteroidaceae bacterium]|nr:glycosyl hydrolase 115 family protein [Bacteroidaceae bacterium]
MRKVLFLLFVCCTLHVGAAEQFVSFTAGDVCMSKWSGEIRYDENDWKGVRIAIDNLKEDLRKVTGRCDYPITVGTYGRSALVKGKEWKSELKDKWEKFIITVDESGLVIAGSDKRGTIFGIYELSRQLGVSPWYWMADAPVAKHSDVYLKPGRYTDGEPRVKYRGIFINDEWPSFGSWCNNQFGGVNSKAYAKIFELLLRLKANYFWPAMWATAFNEDDPLSPQVADEIGIVMGTSHHEPMMRAHKEYTSRRDEVGPWDYSVNAERLDRFFREGIERNKDYENIVTIGMRGDGDVAMGKGDDADNMKTLT